MKNVIMVAICLVLFSLPSFASDSEIRVNHNISTGITDITPTGQTFRVSCNLPGTPRRVHFDATKVSILPTRVMIIYHRVHRPTQVVVPLESCTINP